MPVSQPDGFAAVEYVLHGGLDAGGELELAHPAVVDDVDVDDRRGTQAAPARGLGRSQQLLEQAASTGVRNRADNRIGPQLLPTGEHLQAAVGALYRFGARSQAQADAGRAQGTLGGRRDHLSERSQMKADVAGVVVREQPFLQRERAERKRPIDRGHVQCGQRDQIPQQCQCPLVLAVLCSQPPKLSPSARSRSAASFRSRRANASAARAARRRRSGERNE